MESSGRITAAEASAALTESDAVRSALARGIAAPSWFFASLGAAIAAQIAATAAGLANGELWTVAAGLVTFAVVAGVQLARFRRRNGVWLGGFASRVVLGSGARASASYAIALAAAIWASYRGWWWLVALCAAAGGVAYALSGRRWLRTYRAQPADHARGESAVGLVLLAVPAVVGIAVLLLGA